jgi:hypothetical protein
MTRSPRFASGQLRLVQDTWTIELSASPESTSWGAMKDVGVLVWDRSIATEIERVSEMQQVSLEDAVQGLSSRGALIAGGTNGAEASALFLSRFASGA